MASNGIVHVVDAVLIPPGFECTVPPTIAGIVTASPDHTTLLAAVVAADLADTLNSSAAAGSYTLFAPTDAAFAALPAGALDCLLLPSNKDTLTDVLLYHVLNEAAAIEAADLPSTATNFTTLSGDKVLVDNVAPQLNDASTVTGADIMASNGIVHVVDAVLIPPGFECTVPTTPPTTTPAPALPSIAGVVSDSAA